MLDGCEDWTTYMLDGDEDGTTKNPERFHARFDSISPSLDVCEIISNLGTLVLSNFKITLGGESDFLQIKTRFEGGSKSKDYY